MKIGKRLQQLRSMVTAHYDHIWDCCCDHGLLGMSLLKDHPAAKVHFVDVVPALIDALRQKLPQHIPDTARWEAICHDAGALPLAQQTGKQLIIIAGVGGDLMMEMVSRLHDANPNLDADFLLCPVHHQYALRTFLRERGFKLKDEQLVEENGRFYEMLLVTSRGDEALADAEISAVGSRLWQWADPKQKQTCQQYLTKTLAHYQRIQRGRPEAVNTVISDYQQVAL